MKALGYFTATVFILVFGQILSGFAFATLWEWFVVPQFECKPLTIPIAIGLSSVASYLTHQMSSKEFDQEFDQEYGDLLLKAFSYSICKPIVALTIGYFVKLFV